MMTRRFSSRLGATAACAFALSAAPAALAQRADVTTGTVRPRTENERVVTEAGTPSTINRQIQKDEAVAEGVRPGQVPPAIPPGAVGSSSVPAPAPVTGTVPGAVVAPGVRDVVPGAPGVVVGDPAARPVMSGRAVANPGLDVAMMIEHALGMAIEASALQAIAEQGASPDNAGGGPARELIDHARREMQESRNLLTQAAADGRGVAAGSPTRRFYDAANAYITSLAAVSARPAPASPADKAQMALVNHAVKEVLDANHIAAMGRTIGGSAAVEQLVQHARRMKDDGTQNILRIAGNAAPLPADQPTPLLLAQQGRAVLEAADQLAASIPAATGMRGVGNPADLPTGALVPTQIPGGLPVNGENPNAPGRFQDPRPEIIGGTYSTGSREAGTVNAAGVRETLKETVPVTNPDINPSTPNAATTVTPGGAANPPANSRGGLPPR